MESLHLKIDYLAKLKQSVQFSFIYFVQFKNTTIALHTLQYHPIMNC